MKAAELRSHADRLGFCPQEAVRWLAPGELWRAAVKVMLSSIFASYSDKREIQAGLPANLVECPPGAGSTSYTGEHRSELWIDYVADVGDGFDATCTVACLLAQDKLDVAGCDEVDGSGKPLPRASLLVLGGDQVYPTASARAYEDRMKGPYRAAFPQADEPPLMVALPGNHDWYDGLTAFLRVFGQGHFLGGWRTQQTRSYFAVRLPHRWWLLGLDSQFGAYIDDPQLRFFQEHVSAALQPGDGVIVCAAAPTWVHAAEGDVDAFNPLHFFDREVVRYRPDPQTGEKIETGASVRLWISGDSHHYARYEEAAPEPGRAAGQPVARQLVTCGMGGAYLSATHDLPAVVQVPPPSPRIRDRDVPTPFVLRGRHPDAGLSRCMSWGLLRPGRRGIVQRNPGLWPLVGALHAALFLALAALLGLTQGVGPVLAVRSAGPAGGLILGAWLLAGIVMAAGVFLLSPLLRWRRPRGPGPAIAGIVLQLGVAVGGLVAALALPWPVGWPGWVVLACCVAGTSALTGLLASFAFAAYIRLARTGLVAGWQMSAQSIEDHKGFVRMHIGADGDLTLYPLVVDRVCRDWSIVPDGESGAERPVPTGPLPRPSLVEPPISITRNGR